MVEPIEKLTWTASGRQDRIDKLREEIKAKKEIKKWSLYKFALNELKVSMRVIDIYLYELVASGQISIDTIYATKDASGKEIWTEHPYDLVKWIGE